MTTLRVLVANEPRAYREVLAATFQALRPTAEVALVEPEGLDGALVRQGPHLVISSRPCSPGIVAPLGWVTLYPGHARRVVVRLGERETTLPELEFDGLLTLLDEVGECVPVN